ncbi:MAG: DUF2191 domain-containing protein [Ideonella sp. MAG2]|nr:MAG: DUF2191 domain-containing protein [Ideonella sp. MAG2]
MKTTLVLNDALVQQAKSLAVEQKTTLTRLVEEGLQLRLGKAHVKPKAVKLPIYAGRSGLMAGINPPGNKALLDAADAS